MLDFYRSNQEHFAFDSSYIKRIKNKKSFRFIFMDNLDYIRSLYNSGKLRPVAYDQVQKTILCSSLYLGYDLYECPDCGNESFILHSCHSRLCSKCATKEAKLRSAYTSSMVLDAKHRHVVFTIASELRPFFH